MVLCVAFCMNASAQDQMKTRIDSLANVLTANAKEDTAMVRAMTEFATFAGFRDTVNAFKYANEALLLSEKLNYPMGKSMAYFSLGHIYQLCHRYPEALSSFHSSLKAQEQVLTNAMLSNSQAEIKEAKKHVGSRHYRIGELYHIIEKDEESLQHYSNSIKIGNELFADSKRRKDVNDINEFGTSLAWTYNIVGEIYTMNNAYSDAVKNLTASYKLFEELSKTNSEVSEYGKYFDFMLLGNTFNKQKNDSEALKYYIPAITYFIQQKDSEAMAECNFGLGEVYLRRKDFAKSIAYLEESVKDAKTETHHHISKEDLLVNIYPSLSMAYAGINDFRHAYQYSTLFTRTKDSIDKEKMLDKITRIQMLYDFDKKEALARSEQEKKDETQRTIRNSFAGILSGSLIFLFVVYRQRNKISKEKKRSDELLLNILPAEVAEELKETGTAKANHFDEVTVMFTDFKGFTKISEKLSPIELVSEIHTCFKAFDDIIGKHHIEKIKTMGDSYMCAGGLPVANKTHAADVVKAALEIQQFMHQHLQERITENKEVFEMRIGIHTGPVVAGIVGVKKFAYDIWGDTVNIASRMESSGEAGKVNISGSTYELVKDILSCAHRGKIRAKNKGEIDMYFVE